MEGREVCDGFRWECGKVGVVVLGGVGGFGGVEGGVKFVEG